MPTGYRQTSPPVTAGREVTQTGPDEPRREPNARVKGSIIAIVGYRDNAMVASS